MEFRFRKYATRDKRIMKQTQKESVRNTKSTYNVRKKQKSKKKLKTIHLISTKLDKKMKKIKLYRFQNVS